MSQMGFESEFDNKFRTQKDNFSAKQDKWRFGKDPKKSGASATQQDKEFAKYAKESSRQFDSVRKGSSMFSSQFNSLFKQLNLDFKILGKYDFSEVTHSMGGFLDGLESSFLNSIRDTEFEGKITSMLDGLAEKLGVEVKDIPAKFGQQLGEEFGQLVKNSKVFKPISTLFDKAKNSAFDYIEKNLNKAADAMSKMNQQEAEDSEESEPKSSSQYKSQQEAEQMNFRSVISEEFAKRADQPQDIESPNTKFKGWIESLDMCAQTANIYVQDLGEFDLFDETPEESVQDIPQQAADTYAYSNQFSEYSVPEPDSISSTMTDKLQSVFGSGKEYDVSSAWKVSQEAFSKTVANGSKVFDGAKLAANASNAAGGAASAMGETAAGAAGGLLEGAAGSLGTIAGAMGPMLAVMGPMLIAVLAIQALCVGFGPLFEGIQKEWERYQKAAQRGEESIRKQEDRRQERFKADVESIVREPFEVLKDATNKITELWDNSLRLITATQGYTKDTMAQSMAEIGQRLSDEGYANVIAGTEVMDNLQRAITQGLSGAVAETFAYQVSLLNAAIPTQDFMSFASSYQTIAANAVKNGMSQSEALDLATQSLREVADTMLYTGRELTGGFSMGLQNASKLYEDAVKVSQAARSDNVSGISKVLTAVESTVTALAPNLSSSLTDAIVEAAIGGNSDTNLALRSLAGINAATTQFAQMFAANPEKVFYTIFKNLGAMYNESPDAYMEKAEGYAQLFGLSMDVFSQLGDDFDYLADQIARISTDTSSEALLSLQDNLKLLRDGETTTSAQQLRNQEINRQLYEEGLAYVLDNEVARAIQQHMWDEQIANELMETEYGVSLQGEGLDFLHGLHDAADAIVHVLTFGLGDIDSNPVNYMVSKGDFENLKADLVNAVKIGEVGNGNENDLANLISSIDMNNYMLHLIEDDYNTSMAKLKGLGEEWYGKYSYYAKSQESEPWIKSLYEELLDLKQRAQITMSNQALQVEANFAQKSQYNWKMVSKSAATASSTLLAMSRAVGGSTSEINRMATTLTRITDIRDDASYQTKVSAVVQEMLSNMTEMTRKVDEETGYTRVNQNSRADWEKWANSTLSEQGLLNGEQGVTDWKSFLEYNNYDVGRFEQSLQMAQTNAASQAQTDSFYDEWDYRDKVRENWENHLKMFEESNKMLDVVKNTLITVSDTLSEFSKDWKQYHVEWADYYLKHTYYDSAFQNKTEYYTSVKEAVKGKEKEHDDAVLALAEALTQNTVDLKDPQVQGNVLLAEILKVATAIMNQNNTTSNSSTLADSLAGAALGLTTTTA